MVQNFPQLRYYMKDRQKHVFNIESCLSLPIIGDLLPVAVRLLYKSEPQL